MNYIYVLLLNELLSLMDTETFRSTDLLTSGSISRCSNLYNMEVLESV